MEEFSKKLDAGEIDEHIIEILKIINSSNDYYTTSSCAGRIQLISLPKLGDKPGSIVLGKWHDPIDLNVLEKALEQWDDKNILMLLVQSPVIHVVCRDLKAASKIRNIADGSGFKYSTIRSIHTSDGKNEEQMNITVEIMSTERMDIPLGRDQVLFPSRDYLQYILELAVSCMERARGKMGRLQKDLKEKIGE